MTEQVNIFVNGKSFQVDANINLVEACRRSGAHVPTLCDHPRLSPAGKCGVCVVELEGEECPFVLGCSTKVKEGMRIRTDSPTARAQQGSALRAAFDKQTTMPEHTTKATTEIEELLTNYESCLIDESSPAIQRDMSLCVACTRCVRACADLQGCNVLEFQQEAGMPPVKCTDNLPIYDTECIGCGQCATFCPTGAISERDDVDLVVDVIKSGKKCVVLQSAPATRVAIAEEFGGKPGSIATGKLVAAAKKAGFNYVFDTNFTADLTIMEEGTEFLNRLENAEKHPELFPMFTSCCPGWINLIEKKFPKYLKNLSSCRSPQMMMGPLIKTFWANLMKIKSDDIFQVSLMPCTAKKDEITREALLRDGKRDVDIVLTTREFAKLLKKLGVTTLDSLYPMEYDSPLGDSTGAAVIFGVTGGVMEAALRTAYELKTGKTLAKVEFAACRGLKGVKEATIPVTDDIKLDIAVVSGGANIINLMNKIDRGEAKYHFVEMMACPGGCIGGGGQPRSLDPEILTKRMNAIYTIDEKSVLRKSHENPAIKAIYERFLTHPLSKRSHELLHTHYSDRSAKKEVKQAAASEEGGKGEGLLILYGSRGGTAAAAAHALQDKATRNMGGVPIRCMAMNNFAVADLPSEQNVLFVISTYGEGEFPGNSEKFWNDLSASSATLENVKYSVCGLGSSSYRATYQKAARDLDAKLEELGAQKIQERAEGDEQAPGKYQEAFEPWMDECLKNLGAAKDSENEPRAPVYTVTMALHRGNLTKPCPPGFHFVHMGKATQETADDYERPVKCFHFNLEGSGMSYTTGDHIAVLPRNPKKEVDEFLKWYGLEGETMVSVTRIDDHESEIAPVVSVSELFEQYVDYRSPPARAMMSQLALFATDAKEKAELQRLADPDNKDEFGAYAKEHNCAEVLRAFPSTSQNLPIEQLLSIIPVIKPRAYSIASSSSLHPTVSENTIVIYKWKTKGGKDRNGLCTEYLWSLNTEENPLVAAKIHNGILTYPTDPSKPVLMYGLGSGIAPFRGFLQEREHLKKEGAKLGPCHLWQACRHVKKDFLHEKEWAQWKKDGILDEIHTAFSHDQKEFITIPYVMDHAPEKVWPMISKKDVQVFYCGPAAFNIPATILESMRQACIKAGGMSDKEATEWMADLAANRWFCECF